MKTVYINLDAYLSQLVAWIKGGKSGDAPKFDPLPLAVSVGAGESVGVFAQSGTVSGAVASVAWEFSPSLGDAVASSVTLGLSKILASESASVYAVSGDSFTATATITDVSSPTAGTYAIAFPVIVNRAKASGPVDIVDFTPPAAAPTLTAAAINTALGGTGVENNAPLAGVRLKKTNAEDLELFGSIIIGDNGENLATQYRNINGTDNPINGEPPGSLTHAIGYI